MSYANRTLRSLPFGRIIGGPMVAAIQAQSLAAQATVNFIKEVGFTRPSGSDENNLDASGDMGSVRNVTFKYTRKRAEGSGSGNAAGEEEVSLTVPLLTIVPIPYIRIDEMSIQFTANITEQQEFEASTSANTSVATDTSINFKGGNFLSPVKVNMNAKVSTRTNVAASTNFRSRNQTQFTIDIQVKAIQDEMPAGLAKVLHIMEQAILEKGTPAPNP